ncbi:hypothetical protein DXG01_007571 [Tephrocybe rancida]|nr:hypothetical protein DXG01_007571 [Tephrocybe rancida]
MVALKGSDGLGNRLALRVPAPASGTLHHKNNILHLIGSSTEGYIRFGVCELAVLEETQARAMVGMPVTRAWSDVHGTDMYKLQILTHIIPRKPLFGPEKLKLDLSLRTLRHHRIVLEYLPKKLEDFDTTANLVCALRDASLGCHGAKMLHCDISIGNIMQKRVDGHIQGYLIDWDLSLDMSLSKKVAAHAERSTGTWQFTAVRLLEEPEDEDPPIQDRIDDVESFFHVATWMALRYTSHSMSGSHLTAALDGNFDASYRDLTTDQTYITEVRRLNMETGYLIRKAKFSNPGMSAVLGGMLRMLRERYTDPEEPSVEDRLGDVEERVTEWQKALTRKDDALRILDDPQWLPNLLGTLLGNESIGWATKGERKVNTIVTLTQ